MRNTIIEIDHKNYTENVIVTIGNIKEVKELTSNLDWKYIFKGEVRMENTIKVIEVKRTRDIDSRCRWAKPIITTYKECTLLFYKDGDYKRKELKKDLTWKINQAIIDATYGFKKIK